MHNVPRLALRPNCCLHAILLAPHSFGVGVCEYRQTDYGLGSCPGLSCARILYRVLSTGSFMRSRPRLIFVRVVISW